MCISLVIPAYNEGKYIGDMLARIEPVHRDFFEVIVVDNASTDDTAAVAARYPWVRVVREDVRGTSPARQRGYLEARGDLVAFVDADNRLPTGWAAFATKQFVQNSNLVGLSGPQFYYDVSRFFRALIYTYWLLAVPAYWATGHVAMAGNFVARRTALQKIGGLDTRFTFYGDDTNLARRLSKVGKMAFIWNFKIYSSPRRFIKEGLVYTAWTYVTAFFTEVFFNRPPTRPYTEVR
ncbi:MAG: glycosyltransferase family 2 protein [Patescibacteria group bacterium]|nr:glycosyltransferase family 2 protein [Patescibacteria group bacterium]